MCTLFLLSITRMEVPGHGVPPQVSPVHGQVPGCCALPQLCTASHDISVLEVVSGHGLPPQVTPVHGHVPTISALPQPCTTIQSALASMEVPGDGVPPQVTLAHGQGPGSITPLQLYVASQNTALMEASGRGVPPLVTLPGSAPSRLTPPGSVLPQLTLPGSAPPQLCTTRQGTSGSLEVPGEYYQPGPPVQPGQPSINPATGQTDYSAQWPEYYRSLGMTREVEMREQQQVSRNIIVKHRANYSLQGGTDIARPTSSPAVTSAAPQGGSQVTGSNAPHQLYGASQGTSGSLELSGSGVPPLVTVPLLR